MSTTGHPGLPTAITERRKTPQPIRDEAFRLWISYGRSWLAVARTLNCNEKTLREWGKQDNWEHRRQSDLVAALPGIRQESDVALLLAHHDACIRIQQIAHEAAHNGTKLDYRDVQSLTAIIDRGLRILGITPLTSSSPTDLSSLTDEELLALTREG